MENLKMKWKWARTFDYPEQFFVENVNNLGKSKGAY